ncbi:MAG: hypothetical protein HKP58_04170 [Desulfatitalea sp.]|nr:hypothetical protein [Desulfatitalea sp.]NNJ99588.1 hypothetical protein [Desulfatitalea sp.]
MKGGVRKKIYLHLIIGSFFILPMAGWFVGGWALSITGFLIAVLIDMFFPTWKHDLAWTDIKLALDNLYEYGNVPCELRFIVDGRKLSVYRDEMDFTKKGQPSLSGLRTRMAIRIPLKDWEDIFNDEDYKKLFKLYGEMGMYSENRGPIAYVIFTERGVSDCIELLKVCFEKSVGGIRPDIFAQSSVNSDKNIWVDHSS